MATPVKRHEGHGMAKRENDRKLLDFRLAAGIQAMLDVGFEPTEVARRVVRMIIQIAGEERANVIFGRRKTPGVSPPFTPERLQAEQDDLESCWGGKAAGDRVRQSLDAMARVAADDG